VVLPVIALVGCANVGKSTLFNCLTRSQRALAVDVPGVTRDRQIAQGRWQTQSYILVDTPGLILTPRDPIEVAMMAQLEQALQEADLLFLVVDRREGLTPAVFALAKWVRKQGKPTFLVINKTEGIEEEMALAEFYPLGFEKMLPIAASQNKGVTDLIKEALSTYPLSLIDVEDSSDPRVAIVGRPNVGKSTLINRLVGEERVITCDHAGTTRDSIDVPMTRLGKKYILIDTAGVRKKRSINEIVEKYAAIKTLQTMREAHVVLLIIDARAGITDQDLTLMRLVVEAGKGMIICANKWDGMAQEARDQLKKELKYRLRFVNDAPLYFISALHGTGVGEVFSAIDPIFEHIKREYTTAELSAILEKAVEAHPPPLVRGRRIKLKYAHCGGGHPLTIVIHGNQTEDLPLTYRRYLAKYYMKAFKLKGIPIELIFKMSKNPYEGRRNKLTPRQMKKRQRLMKHVK